MIANGIYTLYFKLASHVFDIVLYQPEVPPNTGNIIRLCANAGARLHLVRPLGFRIDDRALVRAGLDYHELTRVEVHLNWQALESVLGGARKFLLSTRGSTRYDEARYEPGDVLVFGPETTGLPNALLETVPAERCIRLPMVTAARSLNLANAAAIVLYEAWRQNGFEGGN